MTDPKQDVSAQFEAFAVSEYPQVPGVSSGSQMHIDLAKQRAWLIWKAALQSPAVRELVEAAKASVAEIERLRDAMFRVYSTAANGGKTTKAIEAMRDEMDKPWSVDRSRTALRTLGAGHE